MSSLEDNVPVAVANTFTKVQAPQPDKNVMAQADTVLEWAITVSLLLANGCAADLTLTLPPKSDPLKS